MPEFSYRLAYAYARRKGLRHDTAEHAASFAAEYLLRRKLPAKVACHYGMLRAKGQSIREASRRAKLLKNAPCKVRKPFDGSTVRATLAELPKYLYYVAKCLQEGMTQTEIAAKVGCSQQTVSNRIAELREAFA